MPEKMTEEFRLCCLQCGNSYCDSDGLCASCGADMSQIEDAWCWKEIDRLREALESIIAHSEPPFIGDKWQRENKLVAEEALKKFSEMGNSIPEENKKMGCNHQGKICEA